MRIDIERHPDRASVEAAEVRAIQAERPKYNVVHAVPVAAKADPAPRTRRFVHPVALELARLGDRFDPTGYDKERLYEIVSWALQSHNDLRDVVQELRERGYTYAQQADRFDVSEATVSRWAKKAPGPRAQRSA